MKSNMYSKYKNNNIFTMEENTNCRNSYINKFKNTIIDTTNRIIMLSLKNTASGTDLKNATHIFLMEPINDTLDNIKSIEHQVIRRAHCIGQKIILKL